MLFNQPREDRKEPYIKANLLNPKESPAELVHENAFKDDTISVTKKDISSIS